MPGHATFDHGRFERLNDPHRLQTQVPEDDLVRLLGLRGDEDILDLGSGTGFYTDRMAALTTGVVYAVELQPEMNEHYRERGIPENVRLFQGDLTALPVARPGTDLRPDSQALQPACVDVACTIATWHEIEGKLDVRALSEVLRPRGRLVVVDWRRDPDSWESGPPKDIRFTAHEVARTLAPFFDTQVTENLGLFMFAVVSSRQ